MTKIPPYLKKGAMIGLTCPAGYMEKEKAQNCISTLQQWGFEVMVGKTLGSGSENYFSGTDEERLNELQAMLDDPGIDAILCGRGGYGTGRIIDQLDFRRFKRSPKWIIGYSDITVLHAHIFSNYKIASLHAPMAAAFNNGEQDNPFILSLRQAITGKRANYRCGTHEFNRPGVATGELVGGNLSLLTHLVGTPSDLDTRKKILFVEDIGEQIYGVDRMFFQLRRAGKLDNLAGMVVGHFTDLRDTDRPFGKPVEAVIRDILSDYDFPTCYHFPVSHTRENYALKVGCRYELRVTNKLVRLEEL